MRKHTVDKFPNIARHAKDRLGFKRASREVAKTVQAVYNQLVAEAKAATDQSEAKFLWHQVSILLWCVESGFG